MTIQTTLKEEGEFRYLEAGEGHVLILLHGLFGALSNFGPLFDHFSPKYRVVVPILPLYSMPMLSTNVDQLAKFLDRFIKHKGFGEINIIGNSLGGHVALVYASRYPENIRTLTLTGSSGLYENAFGGGFPRREDKVFIKEKVAVTFYDPKHATDELVEECYETINDKAKLIRILSLAKSAIRHNMAKEIPKLQMPTLLIWGREDTITPPHVAEEFHTLLPNSELHWIEKCGHAAMMEHPGPFNAILENWLSKTLGSAPTHHALVTG